MKSGKLKNILTIRTTLGIVCLLLIGIAIHSQSHYLIEKLGNIKTLLKYSPNYTEIDNTNSIQMKLGELYAITTSNGNYNVSIEGIRFTDERNELSEIPAEYVFFLDFNYENISSTSEIYLSDSNFKVIDEQGNVLDNYPVSDDARRSKSIPVGDRCSASATYAMPTSSKTLRVIFYNMYGSPLGETIIETGL